MGNSTSRSPEPTRGPTPTPLPEPDDHSSSDSSEGTVPAELSNCVSVTVSEEISVVPSDEPSSVELEPVPVPENVVVQPDLTQLEGKSTEELIAIIHQQDCQIRQKNQELILEKQKNTQKDHIIIQSYQEIIQEKQKNTEFAQKIIQSKKETIAALKSVQKTPEQVKHLAEMERKHTIKDYRARSTLALASTLLSTLVGVPAGAVAGFYIGAAIGGAVGSVVPVVGNLVGAVVGGCIGALVVFSIGYFGGSNLVGKLAYDRTLEYYTT